MKMTKTIKDYISNQIEEKANAVYAPRIAAAKAESDKAVDEFNNALAKFKAETEAALLALCREHNMTLQTNSYRNNEPRYPSIAYTYVSSSYLPAYEAEYALEREQREKTNKAITDIIVSMELGGDKKELMKLLEDVSF